MRKRRKKEIRKKKEKKLKCVETTKNVGRLIFLHIRLKEIFKKLLFRKWRNKREKKEKKKEKRGEATTRRVKACVEK